MNSKKLRKEREKFKEVDDSLDHELTGQGAKLLTPLKNIVGKTSKFKVLYIAVNAITIVLGIVLLVWPDVSMAVWGLIFLYTGMSNLVASVQSMNLWQKIREKRFKEIVFDAKSKH